MDYDELIRLYPNSAAAYSNRASMKLLIDQPAEALADLNEVIRLRPDYAPAFGKLTAEVKVTLGRIDEARLDFQTALELAEQQGNNDLKALAERHLQELNNPTLQTDET